MRRILNCVFRCREHLPCFNEWRDSQTTCFLLFHSDSVVRRRKVLGLSWWSDLFLLPNVALPSFHVIYNPLGWPSSKGSLSYYVAFLWQAKANFFPTLFRYHFALHCSAYLKISQIHFSFTMKKVKVSRIEDEIVKILSKFQLSRISLNYVLLLSLSIHRYLPKKIHNSYKCRRFLTFFIPFFGNPGT